jgi:hypothetical protein
VLSLLIHNVTPFAKVPMPSVTMNGSMPSQVVSRPLSTPIPAPTASAATIAAAMGHPSLTLRTATIIADKVRFEATDRSKSPVVIGISTPRVSTAMTACEPRMLAAFAWVRKMCGLRMPNKTITASQATMSP